MPVTKESEGKKLEPEAMPVQMPPREEEKEPERFVPGKDHQSYDTPSGRALAAAGAPDLEDAGSDKERRRGLKYLSEKSKMRWGYSS